MLNLLIKSIGALEALAKLIINPGIIKNNKKFIWFAPKKGTRIYSTIKEQNKYPPIFTKIIKNTERYTFFIVSSEFNSFVRKYFFKIK